MNFWALLLILMLLISTGVNQVSLLTKAFGEMEEEQLGISVLMKRTDKGALLAVKNHLNESIFELKLKSTHMDITSIKAKGWESDTTHENRFEINLKTERNPITPNKSLIILVLGRFDTPLVWFAYDKNGEETANGESQLSKLGEVKEILTIVFSSEFVKQNLQGIQYKVVKVGITDPFVCHGKKCGYVYVETDENKLQTIVVALLPTAIGITIETSHFRVIMTGPHNKSVVDPYDISDKTVVNMIIQDERIKNIIQDKDFEIHPHALFKQDGGRPCNAHYCFAYVLKSDGENYLVVVDLTQLALTDIVKFPENLLKKELSEEEKEKAVEASKNYTAYEEFVHTFPNSGLADVRYYNAQLIFDLRYSQPVGGYWHELEEWAFLPIQGAISVIYASELPADIEVPAIEIFVDPVTYKIIGHTNRIWGG